MAVFWGLDLHEVQLSKFKGSYMFNRVYHLRRSKMIVYQLAMIACVVSKSLGTRALSAYVDQQNSIASLNPLAVEYNNDFVGAASYNIFIGTAVAIVFGSAFFLDLMWPERHESRSVRLAWKICAVVVSMMALADALALTIIVATRQAHIGGVDASEAIRLLAQHSNPDLVYRRNGRALGSAIMIWFGATACFASTYILIKSHIHDDKYGPKTAHVRKEEEEKAKAAGGVDSQAVQSGVPAAPVVEPTPREPAVAKLAPMTGENAV